MLKVGSTVEIKPYRIQDPGYFGGYQPIYGIVSAVMGNWFTRRYCVLYVVNVHAHGKFETKSVTRVFKRKDLAEIYDTNTN